MAQVIFPAVVVPGSTADPAEPSSPSDGQIWVDTDGTAPTTVVTRWSKTPTNGTTTLSGTDDTTNVLAYTPGYEQVFLNGVLLSRGSDYTATTGTSVVLSVATITSDIVEIIAALQVAYTDTITTAAAATTYVAKALTTTTGDIIYASAANTPARLGIGSSAQVLTVASGVPSWATASTGAMTLISTTSFSGATTANIDSIFSSSYTAYKVILSRWNTSGNTCVFKLRYGGTTQSTNYYGVATGINSNGTSQSTLSSAGTSFGAGFDNQTGSGVLELTFLDVGTSAIQPMWHGIWNGHGNYIQLVGGQINANWQTYTGIQFLSASGNVSGTVSVYGISR